MTTRSTIILLAVALILALAIYEVSATHGGHVKLKVYRGSSHGHGHHKFAPWGYYAHVPADEGKHGHHG